MSTIVPIPRSRSAFAASSDGVKIARTVTSWRGSPAKLAWTDTSTDTQGTALGNAATYTVSGLAPGADYLVFTNGVPMGGMQQADGSGELTVSGVPLSGPTAVRIEAPAAGTVFLVR